MFELYKFAEDLSKDMIVNIEGVLGFDLSLGDSLELICLNRIFRQVPGNSSTTDAIDNEADSRHVDSLRRQLHLSDKSKPLATP